MKSNPEPMEDDHLTAVIQTIAAPHASAHLRDRVRTAAQNAIVAPARKPRHLPWGIAATTAVATGLIFTSAMLLAPKASAAPLLDRIMQHSDAMGACHWVTLNLRRGGQKIEEGWWDHGKYRSDDLGETNVWQGGVLLRRTRNAPFVTRSDGKERPWITQHLDFRPSKAMEPDRANGHYKYEQGRSWSAAGRHLTEFIGTSKEFIRDRRIIVADTDHNLMTQITFQTKVPATPTGEWRDISVTKADFAPSLPKSVFAPKTFKGIPIIDLAKAPHPSRLGGHPGKSANPLSTPRKGAAERSKAVGN